MKRFFNCRFSMTFWMLHGFSCVAYSYERHGALDYALVASAASQWLYLVQRHGSHRAEPPTASSA